jgi:uncharacterized DUF497 family protein
MYKWNEDKNSLLKSTRGYSFNELLEVMEKDGVLANYKHPNTEKYPNQYIYVVMLDGYVHYVPYVMDGDDIFLKNIIPSRKLHKKYGET